jgi:hypothetical protein
MKIEDMKIEDMKIEDMKIEDMKIEDTANTNIEKCIEFLNKPIENTILTKLFEFMLMFALVSFVWYIKN